MLFRQQPFFHGAGWLNKCEEEEDWWRRRKRITYNLGYPRGGELLLLVFVVAGDVVGYSASLRCSRRKSILTNASVLVVGISAKFFSNTCSASRHDHEGPKIELDANLGWVPSSSVYLAWFLTLQEYSERDAGVIITEDLFPWIRFSLSKNTERNSRW